MARDCCTRWPTTAASTPRSTRPSRVPAASRLTSRICTTFRSEARKGRQFRKVFVPSPGTELLVADYNQIELRCIAHLAADPGLIEAFTTGQDIHQRHGIASLRRRPSRGDGGSAVEGEEWCRTASPTAWRRTASGQRLNIPVDEAAPILDAYFVAFPNVKAYMDSTVVEARERGYTETLFGRRRPIPELMNSNFPRAPGGGASRR